MHYVIQMHSNHCIFKCHSCPGIYRRRRAQPQSDSASDGSNAVGNYVVDRDGYTIQTVHSVGENSVTLSNGKELPLDTARKYMVPGRLLYEGAVLYD